MATEPWQMEGVEVARLIREKQLSAAEVAESQLARIDAVNGKLNAIVRRTDDDARAIAASIDDGSLTGPNSGMTMTTKVNTDHLGHPNDNGIRAMAQNPSPRTAPCVEGMLGSGMIMVGRTNTPALSMRFHTDNALHGETLNPHGAHITAGGSSGGAGAAVAAGLCHVAQGNDVGGSVRWPAYCNGVIGLRPTIGRMVTGGTNPTPRTWGPFNMATQGPLARTMADMRAVWSAMNEPNWADPTWVPAPLEFPRPAGPVKVALVTSDSIGIDPAVVETVQTAGRLLADAGYEVDEVAPPMLDELFSLWTTIGSVDMLLGLVPMLPTVDDEGLTEVFTDWQPSFPAPTAETFMKAHALRDMMMRAWNAFFETHPLVVMPVLAVPYARRGQDREGPGSMAAMAQDARYALNLPAIAIPSMAFPVGANDGAPTGVQIAAHMWREDLILDAGDALEQRLGKVAPVDPAW